MRFNALAAGLAAILTVAAGGAVAHHSVSGQFDVEAAQEWRGVISKIDWINPHIYLHLDVLGEDGSVTTWMMETAPPAMMQKAGLTSEKLRDGGSEVVIRGIPARDENLKRGFIYKITYPDGHYYQFSADR